MIRKIGLLFSVLTLILLTSCGTIKSENSEPDKSDFIALVTGITGNQGGGVAGTLLERGYHVRGMTRDTGSESAQNWANLGAEMVYGDFTYHDSIESALKDADFLFINLQEQVPNYIDETKFLLDAAKRAGVKHIMYSSNRRSEPELPQSASKTEIERYLRASGSSYTTVRIPQMMSNFVRERDMANVLRNGVTGRGTEGATFAYFAPDDLGLLAAAAIEDMDGWNGREVNLSGEEISDKDLAELLSELSGLEIKYTPAPAQPEARWIANQGLSYDTTVLRAEFPSIMTLREYLIKNDYGAKLKEMSTKPLPEVEPRVRPGNNPNPR